MASEQAAAPWWRTAAFRRSVSGATGMDGTGLWAEIERAGHRFGDTAIRFHSREWPSVETTVGAVIAEAEIVARGLMGLGLRQGDVIVAQLPHCVEGVLTFLAALRLGLVVVPVVHIYGPAEMTFILRQSEAKALIVPARWRGVAYADRTPGSDEVPSLQHLIVVGDEPVARPAVRWSALVASTGDAQLPDHAGYETDVATMIYTSGTTASPKGVLHCGSALAAETVSVDRVVRVAPRPAMLAALPAGHMGGITAILRPFLLGTPTDYLDHWNVDLAIDLIERHQIVWTSLTPFHLSALLDSPAPDRLRSLVSVNLGATSIPPSLIQRARERGMSCNRAYGSSEHPTISAAGPDEPFERRMNTDGLLMPTVSVRLVDEQGKDVPCGTPGEIWSRGDDLFVGYFDETLDAQAFAPGDWYRTGDIGVMDAEGYLTIVDRLKDIIIRGGENISSKEIEDALCRHPAVAAAAAVGWPDDRYGERVGMFVELRPGQELSLDEVRAFFAAEGLARQKTPERLVVIDALPRNASGKIVKTALRDQVRSTLDREKADEA
jgi:acyl-CoA synthetase (AMP-forming)/AMP-acid ligase II